MDTPQPSPTPYTPPVTPAPTPQQIPPTTGSHMGMLLGFLAAVVVLAAAAYYFLVMKGDDVAVVSPSASVSVSSTPTPSPTATATPVPTAGWTRFSSQYFTLSFMVPPGVAVIDGPNTISIGGVFMALNRYPDDVTKEVSMQKFREYYQNIKTSSVMIDGASFTRMEGVDPRTGNRTLEVFFDQSSVIAEEGQVGQPPRNLGVADQILSTFKFAK